MTETETKTETETETETETDIRNPLKKVPSNRFDKKYISNDNKKKINKQIKKTKNEYIS